VPKVVSEHIGFITAPRKLHKITIADVAFAFTSGDMVSDQIHTLSCATLAVGMGMQVHNIKVWEGSPAGTQIKAALRFHFFKTSYTQPAQDAPWKGPLNADRKNYLGFQDLISADYLEVGDGTGTDPDYALADKVLSESARKTFYAGDVSNTLWCNVEIRETKTYTGPASLYIELDTVYV